ncbi:hypothetical protein EG68_00283 [Paragonimus skrjabini miyazakii]|uniref:3-hydroxyisobutyryl-CoA hydrolase, mitochondrial n=1 Tax=Paragonimus skrjabini miyazakii TaxID=59628 RepID=A0A8S9Z4P0_9TREM|nr:hypothetical protein EG68_00283 [Paragonimus skrjabini miyazakii]
MVRYRVATENTLFAMPETALGLFPDVGGGYFLPRLACAGLGNFLALTGHRLRGLDVLWTGIATHYRPSIELETLKNTLCHMEFPPIQSSSDLDKIDSAVAQVLHTATEEPRLPESLAPHLDAIADIFALFHSNEPVTIEDILRKLSAYGDKGATQKAWADKLHELLLRMSPTSLRVTLRQLQQGSKLSFADTFKMEFRLSQHFVHSHDFAEGVRAILIDKDNNPKWNPEKLSDVTPEMVNTYFAPVPGIPEWHF